VPETETVMLQQIYIVEPCSIDYLYNGNGDVKEKYVPKTVMLQQDCTIALYIT
jgi:hypothetical protein